MSDWGPRPDADASAATPRLGDLLEATLFVPIRSSTGATPDAARTPTSAFRHGTDAGGPFLPAYTTVDLLAEFGPPGTDHVAIPARAMFGRAEEGAERLVIDPASPSQIEMPAAVLPFLAAGIDPTSPDAMAARRPHGELPPLEEPADVPAAFASALRASLAELGVQRAWLLRAGQAWTVGVELAAEATLADFDAVRNRLRGVAAEQLGAGRDLVVTDLRAPAMREAYDAVAGPFYIVDRRPKGFLSRLLGND